MTSTATPPTAPSSLARRIESVVQHRWSRFVAVGLAGWSIWSADDSGPILCPFRRCTGGYCPGCGATRSAGRLMRGDIAGAWSQHPIAVLLAAQALVVAGWLVVQPDRREYWRRSLRPLFILNGVALMAIWVVRVTLGVVPVPFG